MEPRKRTLIGLCLVGICASVLTATAAGLYEYTPEEQTGPEQPIAFNHEIHAGSVEAGNLGMQCLYCHGPAARGQHATVPPVSTCLGCHNHVKVGRTEGSAEEIAKIQEFAAKGESIPWIRIHDLPDHVQFKHMRHVNAGVACQECHGEVQNMKRVYLVPQMQFTRRSLWTPSQKLEMGWCMECHLERGGSDDCAACHY
ncbi:MAG: cytochrome c3 family protein [Deltaproteobacteria bacterium]|nr:cytochrome c3 family protein [Deltaproteobacteria bacterium]